MRTRAKVSHRRVDFQYGGGDVCPAHKAPRPPIVGVSFDFMVAWKQNIVRPLFMVPLPPIGPPHRKSSGDRCKMAVHVSSLLLCDTGWLIYPCTNCCVTTYFRAKSGGATMASVMPLCVFSLNCSGRQSTPFFPYILRARINRGRTGE